MIENIHRELIRKTKEAYKQIKPIICPTLGSERVYFNSNGFNHLRYHVNGVIRPIQEQEYKLKLLPLAVPVIIHAKEVESYRFRKSPTGSSRKGNENIVKNIHYWSLISVVGKRKIGVRVILRKIGTGVLHFWSIMII